MAATDARPVPRKNTAFRYYFAIRKNDGTLITSWTGADSEVSIDGATFSDCTNEATEIGTTGVGYIDLTASEMNGDAIVYKLTVTNTSALPLVVTFFPEETGDYRVNVEQFGGSAGTFSGGRPEVNASHAAGTAWNSGAITANTLAADAITAAKVAADVTTELQSGLATAAALAQVQADTDDIQARLPAALVSGRIDASVGAYQSGLTPLQPTVAGRTLAVTAAGQAGIDWANVGSPTTTLNLSGTTISTSQAVASVSGAVGSVTGNVGGNVTGSVGSVAAGGITASSIAADAIGASELAADAVAEIAGAVWDITLASHLTGGTTGNALNAAGSAGDPWSTALPGAYSAGSAGYIMGTNLNATVSSRLASASYTAPLDAAGTRSAVGLASANLDTQLDALPTATENADALLKRDWSSVTGEAARSVLNALRFLRNKWTLSGGTVTVYKEDDATTAWSGSATTAASDPVSSIDPS